MVLTKQLGIRIPIFVAPMAGVSTPELAAAVSNAGGLGSLGLGASSAEQARDDIVTTRKLTSKPFQVNFFCHQPNKIEDSQIRRWIDHFEPMFKEYNTDAPKKLSRLYESFLENDSLLQLVLELKPKAVSFHFGLPRPEQINALKSANILTMVSVTQISEAVAAKNAGIDILVAQGVEAGGHRGMFNPSVDPGISTSDLVSLLAKRFDLPIVAAGGIMCGEDIKRMLDLGASAVQLGTAFVQCSESNANAEYIKQLFEQPHTQISTSISGRPARGLLNKWHTMVDTPERPANPGYPVTYDLGKQLNQVAVKHGEHGFGSFWAGSNVSKIRKYDTAELVSLLEKEMSN